MIRRATLSRVSDTAESGRNKPIRAGIKLSNDQYVDVYLKPAGWRDLHQSSIIYEYVSACVAGLLNLPICEPFWVDCPDALLRFCPIVGGNALSDCIWPAFATCHAGPQWRPLLTSEVLPPNQTNEALKIFAFDGFLDNCDRRYNNPNLLVKGYNLRMIDHELVFSFAEVLPFLRAPPAWETNSLDWMTAGERQHILYPSLRKLDLIDLTSVIQSWSNIMDKDLDLILNELPPEFNAGRVKAEDAVQRVKDVRDNIDRCVVELERILS